MLGTLDRRGFLKTLAAGGLGAAAQGLGLAAWERAAQAAHLSTHTSPGCGLWGDLVNSVVGNSAPSWDCGNFAGKKILEIVQYGGASQWETFWLSDNAFNSLGAPDFNAHGLVNLPLNDMVWTGYQSVDLSRPSFNCLPVGPDASLPVDTTISGTPIQASKNYSYFAHDSNGAGAPIYWGAPAKPLWNRPDILKRCRMLTLFHEIAPHEAAVPFGLTGLRLGNPRMAATGAAIQRRARAVDSTRLLPASYVLHTGAPLAESAAAATGEHPGSSRPVVIHVRGDDAFAQNLARTNITKPQADDLLLALRHEYRDRLRYGGTGSPIRSAGFEGYWAAAELLKDSSDLQALFPFGLLVIDDGDVKDCPTFQSATTQFGTPVFYAGAKTMLNVAVSLLTASPLSSQARYVCVIDSGLTGSYDTHGGGPGAGPGQGHAHLHRTSANQYDVLKQLANIIHHPTYNPSGTLNLDETMVVITTEFGRTDGIVDLGRDHHPLGYVTTFIGGPIPLNVATIGGAIGRSDGITVPSYRYSPTDVRGAMLLVAGIDPFAAGNFREADFSPALTDNINTADVPGEIRNRLKGQILGL